MKRNTDSAPGDTRQRILLESSRLFAQHGYYGTSTRDIAETVGIRQPSLFHHFAAKHAILAELINLDVGSTHDQVTRAHEFDADWADRLHFFMLSDNTIFLSQEFDAGGLYGPAVFVEPELEDQRHAIFELHRRTQELITSGITSGEFIDIDPEFVRRASTGISFEGMRERGAHPQVALTDRPLQIADFVLRSILQLPDRLPDIRRRSIEHLARTSPQG